MDIIEDRQEEFRRNMDLEEYLKEINHDLEPTEKVLLAQRIQSYPVIFIMGALRSGTTLMLQWLASTKEFSYPSNIISRFYGTPIIGSKIQRLLTDSKYNFRNEIIDFNSDMSFASSNGKTQGALEPNEFWYFWRRFLPENLNDCSNDDLLRETDVQTLREELWGVAQVFDKPLALKGMICNYYIPFLHEVFSKAIFISMQRNMESQIQSVLKARKRQLGSYDKWYSFLIPEYEELRKIDNPEKQVKGQIECINNAVKKGLEKVPEHKKIFVEYEKFCMNPEQVYRELRTKLLQQGYEISEEYKGVKAFQARM